MATKRLATKKVNPSFIRSEIVNVRIRLDELAFYKAQSPAKLKRKAIEDAGNKRRTVRLKLGK